ncbi:MAG: DUF3108 domain-containing protein [Bacteroidales bacterium]|nr:DUF3108 domain-containing protein [Bacteroidales bacterium]
MKKSTLFLLFLAFAYILNAQSSAITGTWLLTRAEINDQEEEPMQIINFKDDGIIEIMGMELGTWVYNEKKETIDMTSDLDEDFGGENKILVLNHEVMVLQKAEYKLFYERFDADKVELDNRASGLEGTWQIQSPDQTTTILTLELPDSFTLIEAEEGMTSTDNGTWVFDPITETLIIIGLRNNLAGKNKLISHTAKTLELENNGVQINAEKSDTGANKIERLEHTEYDFYDENGDYKYYDEAEKLPWADPFEMLMGMTRINRLIYAYSTMVGDSRVFNTKTLTAEVSASDENQTLSIDYIFYGYDRYGLPDDTELPPNNEYTEPLFPLKDLSFRVVGNEQITTPAGTFECTVVEAANDFEVSMKLWMINDKPGIYAKIIEDDKSFKSHYAVYELQEIQ